tara:strand:- start:465 stop:2480 length:2016 start_codon:yes stop_codon:yes gene_type:complete
MIEKFINYINDKNKAYIIFDIGSRDCEQSIEFYKTFPNAKIYAFECNPNTLNLCEENIIPYQDRITLIKGAVCDYDGSITFYPINQKKTKTTWKNGNPGASSLFKSNGKYTSEIYVQDEITTNCHRLDTIMNKYNIPCVDIIWMDLQGAELLALKSLENKLSSVEYIYTEVSHKEIYTGQVMYKELNDYMIKNNFSILNNLSLRGWQEDVIYKKRKNKIKIAMITFCAGEEYKKKMKIGVDTKKIYCKKKNIDFILNDESSDCYDNTRPYAWSKILMIKKYLPYYNYIFWSDADVLIKNFDFDLLEYINSKPSSYNFLFTKCWNYINSGNFFIKNTPETFIMLDLIYSQKQFIMHPFWEQQSIIHLLQTNTSFMNMTFLEDNNRLYNSYSHYLLIKEGNKAEKYVYKKNDFLIHYCGINANETSRLMNLDTVYIFDIVIPIGPNDKSVINEQIKYTQKNIIGYRNIYLICYDPSITIDGCITINENIFPFNIETVAEHHGKLERNGWYLQQLLKLYAGKIIPNILDKYLVIDSDTFFLKPTIFVENNKCLYNYGTEYHKPYFHHMEKLDKDLIKIDKTKSGICHHMIFDQKYIDELIYKIEKNHNELFYNIFLKTVTDKSDSGASEYEIYFNYMLKYNPDKIQIRRLNWINTDKLVTNSNYDYISYHWYMR